MNRFFFLCSLLLISISITYGQNPGTKKNSSLQELLEENLIYPKSVIKSRGGGSVVLTLRINEEGYPDSVFFDLRSLETLNNETKRVVELATNHWDPIYLGDRPPNSDYFISASFIVSKESLEKRMKRLDKLIQKEKYLDAYELVEDLIFANRFNHVFFEKRAEIHKGLKLFEKAQNDSITSAALQQEVLANVLLVHEASLKRRVYHFPKGSY